MCSRPLVRLVMYAYSVHRVGVLVSWLRIEQGRVVHAMVSYDACGKPPRVWLALFLCQQHNIGAADTKLRSLLLCLPPNPWADVLVGRFPLFLGIPTRSHAIMFELACCTCMCKLPSFTESSPPHELHHGGGWIAQSCHFKGYSAVTGPKPSCRVFRAIESWF